MIPQPVNIQTLPASAQNVVAGFVQKLLESLGENAVSILVYGSAAGVNYNPGISNINLAVIVRQIDFSVLKQCQAVFKKGQEKRIATPLLLTKDYIQGSLDVFPLEYCEIKANHIVIFGEDFFKDLDIPLKDLRLLCEQQIKGKLLNLRQAYLGLGEHREHYKELLIALLGDLLPVFRQLIVFKGQKPLGANEEMIPQMAGLYAVDGQPFLEVYQRKHKKISIPPGRLEELVHQFIVQLEGLSRQIDLI